MIKVMNTPNKQAVEYEIDDEIKDLDTIITIELTAFFDTS
jgi:hypothetical protein